MPPETTTYLHQPAAGRWVGWTCRVDNLEQVNGSLNIMRYGYSTGSTGNRRDHSDRSAHWLTKQNCILEKLLARNFPSTRYRQLGEKRLLLFREVRGWVVLGCMRRGGYGAVGYVRDVIARYDV